LGVSVFGGFAALEWEWKSFYKTNNIMKKYPYIFQTRGRGRFGR